MKKLLRLILVPVLAASLVLGGCSGSLSQLLEAIAGVVQSGITVPFDQMEYTRPDRGDFLSRVDAAVSKSQEDISAKALMDEVYGAYEAYYHFYTNYNLAYVRYCADVTDIYWEQEYNACMSAATEVDGAMDRLLYALADCPLRQELESDEYFGPDFFSSYEGDSLWDETFTALMEKEAALEARYYELSAQSMEFQEYSDAYFDVWGSQFAQLFVEMVAVRREIAQYAGYDSYVDFAYEFYYLRDYTKEQAVALMDQIREEMVLMYVDIPEDVWYVGYENCSPAQSLQYVRQFAGEMGGTVKDAFRLMEENGLFNNAVSDKKYETSFELYLYDYYAPYIFLNSQGIAQDKLTFAHEFGHFCNDYATGGSVSSVDVAEVFSQSMEYLSLCYTPNSQELTRMQLASSLNTFVVQSAYAMFEHRVYELEAEELTVENVQAVYAEIGEAYGFGTWGFDSREYTMIPHFFTYPMYIVSYVVSNTAAMQLYAAELENAGSGLALLEKSLSTQQACFVAFTQEAGLSDPFRAGSIQPLAEVIRVGIWGE